MMDAFGRSSYPKCDGVLWEKPVKESCPKFSMPFLLEKTTKKAGTVRYCQNEECDYKMAVETQDVKIVGTAAEAATAESRE